MDRKEIKELIGIPVSNLSDWSRSDDNNWRKSLYILLSNIEIDDAKKLIKMGDIKNMSLEQLEKNIDLYVEIKEAT